MRAKFKDCSTGFLVRLLNSNFDADREQIIDVLSTRRDAIGTWIEPGRKSPVSQDVPTKARKPRTRKTQLGKETKR